MEGPWNEWKLEGTKSLKRDRSNFLNSPDRRNYLIVADEGFHHQIHHQKTMLQNKASQDVSGSYTATCAPQSIAFLFAMKVRAGIPVLMGNSGNDNGVVNDPIKNQIWEFT